jgi:hypothetical protein
MLKLIYLARRKPGFTFDEFIRRWRMHGARGMAQPIWRHALGYVQAEPIRPAPIAGASEAYDAVACFMVRDEMFAEFTEQDAAGSAVMAADELETFAAPIPTTSLWVDEERVVDGELGGTAAYLFFADAETAREVAARARSTAGLSRVFLNRRRDDGPLGPGANTLPYEAVVELSARDVPTLVAAVGSDGDGLLSRADVAVVTREAVLWDRLPR